MLQVGDPTFNSQRRPEHMLRCHGSRPRLRGWSHALATFGAVLVTIGLLGETYDDWRRWLSVLVFGLTMIGRRGQVGERRVALRAQDLGLVRRDRPDLVVRGGREQVGEHEVARACRVR